MDGPLGFLGKQKKPSFFKVFFNDFSTHLPIPPKFIKNFGEHVPNTVALKVSFDKSWEVEVERVEKNVCLKKGWERFVEDNNLERGDFLIFKYSANSTFKVTIYGTTCCVKEVPIAREGSLKPFAGKINQGQVQDQRKRKWFQAEDEQSLEVNGFLSQREILKGAARQVDKRVVIHIDSESSDDDNEIGDLEQSHKRRMEASASQYKSSIQKNRKSTSLSLDRAIDFSSEHPFFQVQLSYAYASGNYLAIPSKFFDRHLKERNREVKLQISNNIWTMNVQTFPRYDKKYVMSARIIRGWKEFVTENGLRMGDVCIFEMIRSDEIVFSVHIYRR